MSTATVEMSAENSQGAAQRQRGRPRQQQPGDEKVAGAMQPPVIQACLPAPMIGDDVWYWQREGGRLKPVAAKIIGKLLTSDEYELLLFNGGGSTFATFARWSAEPQDHYWTLRDPELLNQS